MTSRRESNRTSVRAVRLSTSPDREGFPPSAAWKGPAPVRFCADWRGLNPDPGRETEVRLLWSELALFLRFRCRFKSLTLFEEAEPNGRREELWERDVAEVFLQTDPAEPRRYKEFEVSPNGFWIDLEIASGQKQELRSGLQRRVLVDRKARTWVAELALPMKSLVRRFDPAQSWGVNFYRVEGGAEPRFYSAWQPTGTPQPNFHVPESFGRLLFSGGSTPTEATPVAGS